MSSRRTMTPTLADVAAEVGVSQATASRALADSPLVNENTRRRVWEAAERLRFEPNRLARSLRRGATMAVGLVVPDVGTSFYATALKSAQDTLEAAGYHVLVLSTGRAAARERGRAADAAGAPGRRAAGRDLRRLRGHRRARPCSSTTSRASPASAPWRWTTRTASGCSSSTWPTCTATSGSPTWAPRRRSAPAADDLLQGAGRERLEAFRAAVGRAGLALPPEYLRTSEPASFEEDARVAARELIALAAAADGDGRRRRHARHRACCAGCARRACGCRRTSRSSPSTSRSPPTCSTRR